ncbi:MAG: hypothetical protein Q4C78_05160 [Synergistaceae bacterium]|nr:hypothetical protein [Synergistaceae bacterium]
MTNSKYSTHKFFCTICLTVLVICLCFHSSVADAIEKPTAEAPKEDSAFSRLEDAIKKQKEKFLPKIPKLYEEGFTGYYGSAISKALEQAGIKKINLDLLKQKYPNSALNEIKNMTDEQKLDVAAGILYIKKCCYGRVSKTDIIRESAAIVYYAAKYKVAAAEAFAMADLESHCNPNCVGRFGRVIGPFQVHWKSHSKTLLRRKIVSCREDMFDADKGVHAGVFVFAGYVHRAGSVRKSLKGYLGKASKRYTNMFFQRVNKFNSIKEKLRKSS